MHIPLRRFAVTLVPNRPERNSFRSRERTLYCDVITRRALWKERVRREGRVKDKWEGERIEER